MPAQIADVSSFVSASSYGAMASDTPVVLGDSNGPETLRSMGPIETGGLLARASVIARWVSGSRNG